MYNKTLKYPDTFTNYENTGFDDLDEENFDLDKLRNVLKKIEDPQNRYRSVHVAGTKGKGSICTFTSSILEAAGCKAGLFTSPHLLDPSERIRINGKPISTADLAAVFDRLEGYLGPDANNNFTFFEVYTLMAMLYFAMKKVDFAVFETGLGGRLDATNVIDAGVCGISPISYDHTQVLGGTIDRIALEKADIIKPGAHCVSAPQDPEVLRIIEDKCREQGASLSVVGREINYRINDLDQEGGGFDMQGLLRRYENCRVNMPGDFQVSNCAVAVGICEQLFGHKEIRKDVFKTGIERAFIPGRMEVIARRPFLMIDGAQNAASARQLKYSVERIFKYDRLILLLGISKDKDIEGICRNLVPAADEVVVTRARSARAADPEIIRGYIRGKNVRMTGDAAEALGTAFKLAGANDLVLAAGSFFLIGEIRKMIIK